MLPTAGATPGNRQFVDFFSAQFSAINDGPEVYDVWNKDLRNTLDIVPHAWVISSLQKLPTIYETATFEVQAELALIVGLITQVIPQFYTDLDPQYFNGTPPTVTISTIEEYLTQAAEQHVDAYFELFGLPKESGGDVLKSTLAPIGKAMKDGFINKYLTAIQRLQANRTAAQSASR